MKSNAALWGDLGLCEHKHDNYPASIQASHLAVRFGNNALRNAAYYNLGLAASTTRLDSEGCREIRSPAEFGCKKSTFVCVKQWIQYGPCQGTDGLVAFFARERTRAEAAAKEFASSSFGEPQLSGEALAVLAVYKGERW